MTSTKTDAQPLPMADVLRDLALIRASDLNLSSLLPASQPPTAPLDPLVEKSVEQSYEFAKNARVAIKTMDRGDVDNEGAKVQAISTKLNALDSGLA